MPDPISGDAIRRGAQIGSDMAKAQQAPTDKGVKKFDNVMNEKSKEIEATREVLKTDLATQINQVPEAQKVQIQQEWVNRVSKMEHGDQVRYLSKQIEGPQASLASLEKNLPSVPEGPWKNLAMDRLTEIQGEYSRLDSFLKEFAGGRQFSQQELLATQIHAHQVAQSIEIMSKAVEHSVSGMKSIFQTNV